MKLPDPPLLVVTDRSMIRRPLVEVVASALKAGCRWVMVREKDMGADELAPLVRRIVELARLHGATVLVNDNARVAMGCGADGVHLPQGRKVSDARRIVGRNGVIGVSAHDFDEAQRAAAAGADYITLSPIFLTESKPGYGPALGLAALKRVAASVPVPIVALGGVTPANAAECLQAGATGVAIMGAAMRDDAEGSTLRRAIAAIASGPADA